MSKQYLKSTKILLVGNGFDINFSEKFSKNSLFLVLINKKGEFEFDRIINFANSCKIDVSLIQQNRDILEFSFRKLLAYIDFNNSIEDFFAYLHELLVFKFENQELAEKIFEKFKILFFVYLESIVKELDNLEKFEKTYNKFINKLYAYDKVLTTNWTNILEICMPEGKEKYKPIYLHGKIGTENKPEVRYKDLQLFTYDDEKNVNFKELENFMLYRNKKYRLTHGVYLDIFGFSLFNDDKLINELLEGFKNFKVNSINLRYFFYNKDDHISFEEWCKKSDKKFEYTVVHACSFFGIFDVNALKECEYCKSQKFERGEGNV